MIEQPLILITLLIQLGVSAAVSSVLARSLRFRFLLFHEDRDLWEKLEMVFHVGIPFMLGVVVRATVKNFFAADVSFEASILLGVIAGRAAGVSGAVFMSLPYLFLHQYMNLPLNVVAGLSAGFLRELAADREAIWSFSPLFDLSLYRWLRRSIEKSFIDWQTSFFFMILGLEFLRLETHRFFPRYTWALDSDNWLVRIAIYASTVMVVAIALKVLNNIRIELKLEEQERLLLQTRMAALQSQINPHFLFNTLNSVASLVRFDPDTAREMILKLSKILRRLLKKADAFDQLREEFEFIDDYLDIEVIRFGHDKLKVVREFEAASLDVMVPAMLIQPLVENAIKHGIAPKITGGTIYLRSRLAENMLVIEVEDDGVGMIEPGADPGVGEQSRAPSGTGIGMANVRERLNVLYGDAARVEVESQPGAGTIVRILLPIPQSGAGFDPGSF
jgi:two-component system LytT family sensor kinase